MSGQHTPGAWKSLLDTLPESERFGLTLEDARRADAAPDMLEALRKIERECDPMSAKVWRIARDAIAKATEEVR